MIFFGYDKEQFDRRIDSEVKSYLSLNPISTGLFYLVAALWRGVFHALLSVKFDPDNLEH